MLNVKPKKHLGQHFLLDTNIAKNIVDALTGHKNYEVVLELGPGTGVLTNFLIERKDIDFHLCEIDRESATYLRKKYPALSSKLIEGDFLQLRLDSLFNKPFALIGNFPYNISSQIFFKVLEYKDSVPEIVCMLQKEVAQRIASPPGNKDYGILSVFLQAYYTIEYLFTVPPHVFDPPPKVQSGVIRLRRNEVAALECDEALFFKVVKQGFNNRRKTLRNSLKPLGLSPELLVNPLLDKRAEQLSVADFVYLTQQFSAMQ
ncbi:16S rRNA (adenine(1518)-N(6)/adenine(1519)-N(6))-dimethyltransferase RsmA [Cytophagaceae bacterium YF14B1]|uniref:Ribosomal RNA small subunit methyltransferase A n=1 Tax=Xanthocytophaga flava TaxID=3048013 RepID=A0AAE3U5D7_9BACT|nr:16S rRNA (adenine(1518)-N(6)/adenine(1519)-N(6))-dimethyltransferase RsmA [Xanthocytophaga flavus]MDJ1479432.1 16S rRNA (adenine(1518)-N(6)/adenine(1519)-N(6))-dimethyltransferase RsmA [Xanthocytophaga flavus]